MRDKSLPLSFGLQFVTVAVAKNSAGICFAKNVTKPSCDLSLKSLRESVRCLPPDISRNPRNLQVLFLFPFRKNGNSISVYDG